MLKRDARLMSHEKQRQSHNDKLDERIDRALYERMSNLYMFKDEEDDENPLRLANNNRASAQTPSEESKERF